MMKVNRYKATSAVPAIAAVLALLSTPAIAQEVPAQSTLPPQTVPPVTQPTPSPVAADPGPASVDTTPTTSDPLAPVAEPTVTADAPAAKVKPRKVAKPAAKAAPVKPAPVQAAPKGAHAAPATVPGSAPVAAAPIAAPTASNAAVNPIVKTQPAAPATPANSVAKTASSPDERTMELGGGALALLALGAGAFAMSRRRRHDDVIEEEAYVTEPMESEPVLAAEPMVQPASGRDLVATEEPTFIAPPLSAFSWGNRASQAAVAVDHDGSDRRDGETWVERAYRGPSPANPSASLKNRLRRAAFFDKRERDVAAGTAKPVDAGAGLPNAVMETREPELA